IRRPAEAFGVADYGIRLGPDDRRRRFVIQSLLSGEGLSSADYEQRFASDPLDDLPALLGLEPLGLAARDGDRLSLNAAGLERSDAIGPWLYSERVRRAMEAYAWR